MAGFSCQDEYDHYMSAQADAEAYSESQYYQEQEATREAINFLISMNFTPEMYAEYYRSKQDKRGDDLSVFP